MTIFSLDLFYALAGLVLAWTAVDSARSGSGRQRWGNGLFWGLLALIYVAGPHLPRLLVGGLLLVLVVITAAGGVGRTERPSSQVDGANASSKPAGARIFLPALLVPATAVAGTLVLDRVAGHGWRLLDHRQPTLAALGLGSLLALVTAWRVTRSSLVQPLREGSRLLQTIGWALLLPPLLAALGGVFAKADVGPVVAQAVSGIFPTHHPVVAVAVYALGMAVFTMCMGNAFAAFPVITLGLGLPFIVQQHGGNPAIMAALGMLSGYCGTLLTPLAANFNLVPAVLLELRDPHAVIKAQIPLALVILAANILIMACCVYTFR